MSFKRESFDGEVTITSSEGEDSTLEATLRSAYVRADGTEDGDCMRLTQLEISHSKSELNTVIGSMGNAFATLGDNLSPRLLGCCSFSSGVSVLMAESAGDQSSPSAHLLKMNGQNVRAEFGEDTGEGRPFVKLKIGPFVS